MKRIGDHAVVIGASMAGVLAAPVLAEAFDRVTVIDRDELPEGGEPRRAVPQGRHAHALLPAGQRSIEELLPGFMGEAIAAGAPTYRLGADMRFSAGGHRLARVAVGPRALAASRPLLEALARRRASALANVEIHDRCDVLGLAARSGRVSGVRTLRRAAGSAESILDADLVVAASGRAARVPAWLESLGFPRPREERIPVDILYRSCRLRLGDGAFGPDKMILVGPRPGYPRGLALIAQEHGHWVLTLYGYGRDHHPPSDPDGYLSFAAALADADVIDAVREAVPATPDGFVSHGFPANLRRRYDRLRRFPHGLLVLGDAITSFNPVYGQGMTVASLEALALRRCLQHGDRDLARRFFAAANAAVDHAWKLSAGADLALPQVEARRSLPVRLVNSYVDRLQRVAGHDDDVARAFIEVTGMLRPPSRLMSPGVATRVLRGGLRRRRAIHHDPVPVASTS